MSRRCGTLLPFPILAAAACTGVLAGCHTQEYAVWDAANAASFTGSTLKIPLPSPTLLAVQPQPDCGYQTSTDDGKSEGKTSRSDVDSDQAYRVKLEHERECYREAEIRARERLQQLQAWAGKTVKAVNRKEPWQPIVRGETPEGPQTEKPGRRKGNVP